MEDTSFSSLFVLAAFSMTGFNGKTPVAFKEVLWVAARRTKSDRISLSCAFKSDGKTRVISTGTAHI